MGMDTYVVGIKPPDSDWEKVKLIFDAYINAGIMVPAEIWDYFGGVAPDDKGVSVELPPNCISNYSRDGECGYDIEVSKIPKGIKIIRFYNSW